MELAGSPNESLLGVAGGRWRLNTPALVLDLECFERNVAAMAAHCEANGQALRPHSKSHKSVSIARAQMAAGASGVCCATIREAEVMVGGGIESVLTTSPITTPAKIARLMALHEATEHLLVVTDTPENVAALAEATAGRNVGPAGSTENVSSPPATSIVTREPSWMRPSSSCRAKTVSTSRCRYRRSGLAP